MSKNEQRNFALIGAAGYIAPRHMKAIKDVGGNLVAALDPHDSVGILDSYFPDADFFTEFERFDRHLEKLKRQGTKVDYISICSPNYLHDAHIRFALRYGADAICEKPLVLNPWNAEALMEIEKETGKKVYTILQLRLHPDIIKLKEMVDNGPKDKIYDIDLTYITSRGKWYDYSWKGDISKSGGIAMNIGIHFFDMLIWVFGDVTDKEVFEKNDRTIKGKLFTKRAEVNWLLSINPKLLSNNQNRTERTLQIEGTEFEFSTGFTSLHTQSYSGILSKEGFVLEDALPAIVLASNLRN